MTEEKRPSRKPWTALQWLLFVALGVSFTFGVALTILVFTLMGADS